MPTDNFTHLLFGRIVFKTKSAEWKRGDPITFVDGFDTKEVTSVHIPQLVGIPSDSKGSGKKDGNYLFHKRGQAQLLAAFADIEAAGQLHHVKSCAGAFFPRLRKPTSGKLSKLPSNHSFGIAIDLNSDDGSLGGSVKPVAPFFERQGFLWGIAFSDPMHFEIEKFMDGARPSVHGITVMKGGVALDMGALNLKGHVMVPVVKCEALLGLKRVSQGRGSITMTHGSDFHTFELEIVDETGYILLTEASALAGLTMKWDNTTKTATLA
jgi:hypothetical protein